MWLGTSAEDQVAADERIPHLLEAPAAVRFLSAEPLLGPIDLTGEYLTAKLGSYPFKWLPSEHRTKIVDLLDWVIVGGESGPGARPMHPDWARSLRDQCAAAGVAYFHKQNGAWHASRDHDPESCRAKNHMAVHVSGKTESRPMEAFGLIHTPGWEHVCEVGKKAAGRLLDGVEHNGMPT